MGVDAVRSSVSLKLLKPLADERTEGNLMCFALLWARGVSFLYIIMAALYLLCITGGLKTNLLKLWRHGDDTYYRVVHQIIPFVDSDM